jgi:transcriptional regulator with XRE-family HTH domain
MEDTQPEPEDGSQGEATAGVAVVIRDVLALSGLSQAELAHYLGASAVAVSRWVRGDGTPTPQIAKLLAEASAQLEKQKPLSARVPGAFASRGARKKPAALPLFQFGEVIELAGDAHPPVMERLRTDDLWGDGRRVLAAVLADHELGAPPVEKPMIAAVSAGKNTYTYDAHTYHTKVPPQGIAEILKLYLPKGGLVLDPFAGSGMTGVAGRTLGLDVILNELSPAASFIADRFTRQSDPARFAAGVTAICESLGELRKELYTTRCRECGRETEILYTVWSYNVVCSSCRHEFSLWDECRSYGRTVRDHRILSSFPCPRCQALLTKARLERTSAHPVLLGYRCCAGSQVEHPLSDEDQKRLSEIGNHPPVVEGFYPTTPLPDGVNLRQPKRHGLTSIDRFYTARNLAAMSALWHALHRVRDDQLAGFLAFVFTSLYQRVTRLSEFRFWGGSGNTARFNVPFIFNEANVFVTFERKARTIQDHLETTAQQYGGRVVVRTGSATSMGFLPDGSVDLVFTDPPFGANINYSEMNLLWEAWLGSFTDNTEEAIINRVQNKGTMEYGRIMAESLRECHRVLRRGQWLLLMFMNSSDKVWQALRKALSEEGFAIERVDVFDKQHGTFKQFVSENTAGCDVLLHCRRVDATLSPFAACGSSESVEDAVKAFLCNRKDGVPRVAYLHVERADEVDYRMLYSEFVAERLRGNRGLADYAAFRAAASAILERCT